MSRGAGRGWGVVVVALGLGAAGLGWWGRGAVAQPPASASARGTVHALARLEPAGGLVLAGVRPGMRVEKVLVGVGDDVKAGQPLAVLEGEEEARLQLALAEARKADALAQRGRRRDEAALQREKEDRLRKARVASLDDVVKSLKAQQDRMTRDAEALALEPAERKTREELLMRLEQVKVDAARARLEAEGAKADEDLLPRRRKLEDAALADGGTDDALLDRQVALARHAVEAATLKAPVAGRVFDVLAHVGEVASGPVVALGDPSAMAAVAEVDQADAGSVRAGDAAAVTVQGVSVPGKVTRVGRLVGRNQLTNVDPRLPQDLRVVRVTVALERPEPASSFVNMQVEAVITPSAAPAR